MKRLNLLKEIYDEITIPQAVKNEVLGPNFFGQIEIKKALEMGWVKVVKTKSQKFGLGRGEEEAISLAVERKEEIILDDAKARKIAGIFGLEIQRTTSVLIIAYKKKKIGKKELISLINELIENGYYIAPRFYVRLIEKINEEK